MLLKNSKKYLRRLKRFSKHLEIKIVDSKDCGDGAYFGDLHTIEINFKNSSSTIVGAWLHELGHALDEAVSSQKQIKSISASYNRVYIDKASKADRVIVIESEIRAWLYGSVIARALDIPLGKWYDKQKQSSLKNYKENM